MFQAFADGCQNFLCFQFVIFDHFAQEHRKSCCGFGVYTVIEEMDQPAHIYTIEFL